MESGRTHWSYQLCLLHCHQAIEKILKTIIVDKNKEVKRIHDIIALLEDSEVKLPKELQEYINELSPHYQHSRYPDIPYKGQFFNTIKE